MTYLKTLRDSKNNPNIPYIEFTSSTRNRENHLFCFFEGKDNGYYVTRVNRFTTDYYPIICGNRKNVLKVHELIKNHSVYDRYKKAYFIDRDFNPPLPEYDPPIFETDSYSIENYYCSLATFKEILINHFHLSPTSDEEYETCLTLYQERQAEFHQAVTLFNAWYACLIDMRNQGTRIEGVQLDDKLPKQFQFRFSLDEITSNYDLDAIKALFPNAPEVPTEILNTKLAEFNACDQAKVFRGKYEMQFLSQMIKLLLEDSNKNGENRILKQEIKFPFGSQLSIAQAINVFQTYAETPPHLLEYLEEVS